MNENNKEAGFTLLELLITVAIVGIISAIAIPSYFAQIQKARRADVMDALTDCAAAQARNYTTASPPSYLTQAEAVAAQLCNPDPVSGQLTSKDGDYFLTIANDGCTQNGTNWCFSIIANPVAQANGGRQSNDGQCAIWSIDHRGNKTASTAAGDDTTQACWGS